MTRELATADRVRSLMAEIGRRATVEGSVIFAGGTTAVLIGWRETTRDVDLVIEPPEADGALGPVVGGLRDQLGLNIEFASPAHFIGRLPGSDARRISIDRIGPIDFLHEDPYLQALAKVSRGIEHDREDVAALLDRGLIEPARAWALFDAILPGLYRYPVDPERFRQRMVKAFGPRG